MKTIKPSKLFAASAIALSAFVGQAQAQMLPNMVQITPTKTVDIANARIIGLPPTAQYVNDHNGVNHIGKFPNIYAVTGSEAFKNYVQFNGGTYVNMTQVTSIECQGSATIITWISGVTQPLNDGCAFADKVKALSRR